MAVEEAEGKYLDHALRWAWREARGARFEGGSQLTKNESSLLLQQLLLSAGRQKLMIRHVHSSYVALRAVPRSPGARPGSAASNFEILNSIQFNSIHNNTLRST